jgi:hypothetical protein
MSTFLMERVMIEFPHSSVILDEHWGYDGRKRRGPRTDERRHSGP